MDPITLTGQTVRLEPLSLDHLPGLLAVAEMAIFQFNSLRPMEQTHAGLRTYVDAVLARAPLPFAVIFQATGAPIGVSCFLEGSEPNKWVEIGGTWYATPHWGTAVNPECKYLLMRHAFEVLDLNRIEYVTDRRNTRSAAAIRKLGAVDEGILRSKVVMPDGYRRDNLVFSIVREEWPAVKARLEDRLAALAPLV